MKRLAAVRRRGVTLAETLVSVLIGLAVMGLLAQLLSLGTRLSAKGGDAADALRATHVVLDTMRRDLGRCLVQRPGDLMISADGREVSVLVPGPLAQDLWQATTAVVTYRLVPVPGSRKAFRVVREDAQGARTLPGCLVAELTVSCHGAGPAGLARDQSFLQVTVVGLAEGSTSRQHTGSILLPVARIARPEPYTRGGPS